MLIEDDAALAALLTELLVGLGFDVTHTAEREQAIEAARSWPPDLIVTDLYDGADQRQSWDGVEALMRSAPAAPILVVTGFAQAASDGAQRGIPVLVKPFDLDEFEQAVQGVLQARGQ